MPGGGGTTYDGPRHFDYKPLRTEDTSGVWASAAANMRTYLVLKQRAAEFRAAPGGAGRRWPTRRWPSCGSRPSPRDETYTDLLADRSAWEDFDADAAGVPGYGFVQLNQLAVDHLTGAR